MKQLQNDRPTQLERLRAFVDQERELFGSKVLTDRWDKGYWRAMELVAEVLKQIEDADASRNRE